MRKSLYTIVVLVALLALIVTPVFAVTYGTPDNGAHPYVGLVVLADENGVPLWRCSGTLMSPTVFLTAAHCTEAPAAVARIYFDQVVPRPPYPTAGGYTGVPHPGPDWKGGLFLPNTGDIGVVVLDEPLVMAQYGALPEEGFLDDLATKRGPDYPIFTVVGYGLQSVKPVESALRERFMGTVQLVNLRSALTDGYNIHYSSNAGKGLGGSGGTCFGDSGGPVFWDNTNIVVAVNSFVLNANCKGAGFGYRVDIPTSLAFVNSFMP